MRDPHVERLQYAIGSGPNIVYNSPPPLEFENALGAFVLCDGHLFFSPTEHFATEKQAKAVAAPFLRAWELATDLSKNFGTIRFTFERAELIDRNPPKPGENVVVHVEGLALGISFGSATLTLGLSQYPSPPESFQATLEAELGYRRWEGFIAGRERLPSMAYFVLTLVESIGGGSRKAAGTHFGVDPDVMATIGLLSSTRGDANSARKFDRSGPMTELTSVEAHWLEQATRRLIQRLGEQASGQALTSIRMSELPRL